MTGLMKFLRGYKDCRKVKLSFYRLDPSSKRLIIYNNEDPCHNIEVIVKDWDNQKYIAHIPAMNSYEEHSLPYHALFNIRGEMFHDNIKSVTIIIDNKIENFQLRGREFHRA